MLEQLLWLAASVGTLLSMWLAGGGRRVGWAVALANEGVWLAAIFASGAWGLIPLTAALILVFAVNLAKRSRPAELTPVPPPEGGIYEPWGYPIGGEDAA